MSENIENIDGFQDKYIRLYADFENYKRRVQKEKEDIVINTKAKMLSSILDIDNDISIAIKKIDNPEVISGLSLIVSKLDNFLKAQGIETIQTDKYDSDIHEVISLVDIGETKIIDVASKGYAINGKVFRHPKIILGR